MGGDSIWWTILTIVFQIAMQIIPQLLQVLMDMFSGA